MSERVQTGKRGKELTVGQPEELAQKSSCADADKEIDRITDRTTRIKYVKCRQQLD